MSTGFTIYIIAQFLVSCAVIFGVTHEEKVIKFENRIFAKIKKVLFPNKRRINRNRKKSQEVKNIMDARDILSSTDCFDYNAFSNVA